MLPFIPRAINGKSNTLRSMSNVPGQRCVLGERKILTFSLMATWEGNSIAPTFLKSVLTIPTYTQQKQLFRCLFWQDVGLWFCGTLHYMQKTFCGCSWQTRPCAKIPLASKTIFWWGERVLKMWPEIAAFMLKSFRIISYKVSYVGQAMSFKVV